MKKTDLAMIVLIASITVIIAFFVTRSLLGDSTSETTTAPKIELISSGLDEVNTSVFNENAINPVVEVQITPGSQ